VVISWENRDAAGLKNQGPEADSIVNSLLPCKMGAGMEGKMALKMAQAMAN
jgi:hypothetical protein